MTLSTLIFAGLLIGAGRLFYLVCRRAIRAQQRRKRMRELGYVVRYRQSDGGCWP